MFGSCATGLIYCAFFVVGMLRTLIATLEIVVLLNLLWILLLLKYTTLVFNVEGLEDRMFLNCLLTRFINVRFKVSPPNILLQLSIFGS